MRAAKAAGSSRKVSRAKLFRIKVISLGDQAVGKSCLIKRWVWGCDATALKIVQVKDRKSNDL